ncbi:type IX secretion system membrane protein PorP/SprF [Flavivirga spongiicola]|uniref:Type IX secretion system membrane protein PorP/SprF n=1 Tax=Flavivirga spongiicola TaxID=421621 RepID=A0ABU7Y0T9_9FLAO|nr:PorP/SprF family type IX secretion system membrane protein [Flavivirga sp. MEBiC05379]MDO5980749.1 PorP/SprF family type IX secretion system membrane protein [Flavivirga sp. MEBiC05379]
MKKYLLHIVIFLCFLQQFHTQEKEDGVVSFALPVRNSLKFNRYIINPTFSFVREQNKYISFNNKRQWVQFEDAPQTYLFGYSGRFREDIGVGVGLFQQSYGVLTTFGGVLNFAYNVVLDRDSNLTFGMNLGFYKSGLNDGKIVTNFPDDSLDNIPSNSLLTVNPGINYGTDFLDFGLSINNAVLYNLKTSKIVEDDPEQSIQAHVMYTGYTNSRGFFDESKFSGLIRSEFKKDKTVLSGIAMLTVPKGIWAQVGYNTLYGLSGGLGLNISTQISIEYNFEKAMGDLVDFGSSHDITLAYKFKNRYRYRYSGDDEENSIIIPTKRTRRPIARRKAPTKPKVSAKERAAAAAKAKADAAARVKAAEERAKERAEAAARAKEAAEAKAKADEEAARLKATAEAKAKADEAARLKAAAEAKAKADEAARLKAAAEAKAKADEAARLKAAAEAKAKADEAARLKAAAEAKAKADEAARLKAAAEAKAKADEAARLKAAAEAKAKADEAARLKAAAEAKAKADEAARLKAAAEAKAKADEAARLKAAAEAKAKADEAARLKAAAEAKAKADEAARLKAAAEAKAKADEEARLKAAAEAKAKADEEARLKAAAEAKAKADEAARLKAAAEAKAKADEAARLKATAEAKAKADEEARLKAAAEAKADEEARLKAAAEAKAKADEAARLKAAAEAKAKADEAARLKAAAEAKAKADEAARLKAAAEAKAKADEEARLKAAAEAKAKADEEARLKAAAEAAAKAKAEEEERAKSPVADITKSMNDLLTRLDETVAIRDQDLKDLKEENDLGEKGIFKAPRPFKSITAENAALESLKSELDGVINTRNEQIEKLEKSYKGSINPTELKMLERLKSEQIQALKSRENLMSALDKINVATEIERKRRIKRAAYDNADDRHSKDMATLNRIKQNTRVSTVPLKEEDFDFGEKQSENIQIVKDVKNTESGYYLVIAVHNDVDKRDEFVKKAVSAGQADINFFYDENTSKYFIYYEKFNSVEQATRALKTKGDKPYNGKMSMVKIEN